MRWWPAAAGALALAACIDAPSPGATPQDDDGDPVVDEDGGPDAAAACVVEERDCESASSFADDFEDLEGWMTSTGECAASGGDGIEVMRLGLDSCLVKATTPLDMRCAAVAIHFDGPASSGSDATLSLVTAGGDYYYIERDPPDILYGSCVGGDPCEEYGLVEFDAARHARWRLRGTSETLVAEVAAADGDWTPLGSFPDVDVAALPCVHVELGNYSGGESPSTARFFDLNL